MNTDKVPRLSATESMILDLLRSRDMYGLELVTESEGALRRGTVYVTLARMEEKGYVESRAEAKPTHSGLPRRLYRATAVGARVLDAWSFMAASLASVRRRA
jgi:PadR family transcriptional regulator, regulatory protein PadR